MSCSITKNKKSDVYNVAFKDLTAGEVLSLINALKLYATVSPVADDVRVYLHNGIVEAKLQGSQGQLFYDALSEDVLNAVISKDQLESVKEHLK